MDELIELLLEIIIELIGHSIEKSSKRNKSYRRSISSNYHNNLNDIKFKLPEMKEHYNDYTPKESTNSIYTKLKEEDTTSKAVRDSVFGSEYSENKSKPAQKHSEVTGIPTKSDLRHYEIHENKSKGIRLGVVMMKYIFYQDDLKLSLHEIKRIKKYFKKNSKHLDRTDLFEIKKLITITVSMDEIKQYYIKNKLTQKQFNTAYSAINEIVNDNSKYIYSLGSIKTEFIQDGIL